MQSWRCLRHWSMSSSTCYAGDRHNMPSPSASWQYIRIYSPGGTCSGMLAIKTSATSWPLTFWPWKWCLHLRCDGIIYDQFITQSLPSPRVKIFRKSVNICRSYGQLSTGSFFYETRYIAGIHQLCHKSKLYYSYIILLYIVVTKVTKSYI